MGDFTYAPNREGLDFLLEEVMPRVWAAAPELRLTVAGRGYEVPAGADPRVSVLGFVDSLHRSTSAPRARWCRCSAAAARR